MVHRCMIKLVVMCLHILVVSLLVCVSQCSGVDHFNKV